MSEELQEELAQQIKTTPDSVSFWSFMIKVATSVALALALHNNPAEMIDKLSEARTETIQRMNEEQNNSEV